MDKCIQNSTDETTVETFFSLTRNMVYKKHRGIPTSLVSKICPKLD